METRKKRRKRQLASAVDCETCADPRLRRRFSSLVGGRKTCTGEAASGAEQKGEKPGEGLDCVLWLRLSKRGKKTDLKSSTKKVFGFHSIIIFSLLLWLDCWCSALAGKEKLGCFVHKSIGGEKVGREMLNSKHD